MLFVQHMGWGGGREGLGCFWGTEHATATHDPWSENCCCGPGHFSVLPCPGVSWLPSQLMVGWQKLPLRRRAGEASARISPLCLGRCSALRLSLVLPELWMRPCPCPGPCQPGPTWGLSFQPGSGPAAAPGDVGCGWPCSLCLAWPSSPCWGCRAGWSERETPHHPAHCQVS